MSAITLLQDFYQIIDADDVRRRIEGKSMGPLLNGDVTAAAVGFVTRAGDFALFQRTVLTLDDLVLTMTDATTAGNHGGRSIFTFPAGVISMLAAYGDLTITAGAGGIGDTAAAVVAVGTTVTATDNATLTTTEANIIPSTAFTLSGGVKNAPLSGTTPAMLGTHAAAAQAFLNCAVPDAGSSANDTMTVAGTLTFLWAWGGPDGS